MELLIIIWFGGIVLALMSQNTWYTYHMRYYPKWIVWLICITLNWIIATYYIRKFYIWFRANYF